MKKSTKEDIQFWIAIAFIIIAMSCMGYMEGL